MKGLFATFTIMTLSKTMLCHYAECRIFYYYAECRYAKCRYAKCRYAECRSAILNVCGKESRIEQS